MFKHQNKGFTLIELLIVVAIIAILAAIAIPNFLAAQVRAKVARSRAEMQTLNTALESYYVDNSSYPDDIAMEPPTSPWPWYVPVEISTPIAYISSGKIGDLFRISSISAFPDSPGLRYRYINYDAEKNGHWTQAGGNTGESFFPHPGGTATVLAGESKYGKWRLNSAGPDHSAGPNWGYSTDTPYDPSNGTVSGGDLIRSQASAEVTTE